MKLALLISSGLLALIVAGIILYSYQHPQVSSPLNESMPSENTSLVDTDSLTTTPEKPEVATTSEITVATAQVVVNKNVSGDISVVIIPHDDRGSYPRSGWITCQVIPANILTMLQSQLGERTTMEWFFVATYKIIEEDLSSPVLAYNGELIALEPWTPPFQIYEAI